MWWGTMNDRRVELWEVARTGSWAGREGRHGMEPVWRGRGAWSLLRVLHLCRATQAYKGRPYMPISPTTGLILTFTIVNHNKLR